MQKINLKTSSLQNLQVPIQGTRTNVDLTFRFMPTQMSWYFDFEVDNVSYTGHKLVLGENILRNYKNIIPFGLRVVAEADIEPYAIDDLASGRVSIYILDKDEVKLIEEGLYNEYS